MTGVALIGCGRWGRNLARNLQALGVLRMIVDPVITRADFPQGVSVPLHRDIADAFGSQDIGGVVIAAPAAQHAELAYAALAAGKHTFVEKPLALDVSEAEQVSALAKAKGLTLMIGHLLQYHPAFQRLSEVVAAGEIGAIRHIASNRLNPGAIRSEENALWSLAPHDFSMILSLVAQYPTDLHATPIRVVNPEIPDRYIVTMKFNRALTASVDVSWVSPYKEHRLTVLGERGVVVLDDHAAEASKKLVIYRDCIKRSDAPEFRKGGGETIEFATNEPLRAEMEVFVSAMRSGSSVRTGPDEAIRVLKLLRDAELSASKW